MRLTGHAVLITGGATGIGFGLAQALSARGNIVAVCGRTQAKLDEASAALPGLVAIQCDLTVPEELDRLRAALQERMGRLSLLVNNAATHTPYEFGVESAPDGPIAREIENNLIAPMILTKRLMPMLLAEPVSGILNISSGLGLVPKRSAPMYCAAKAGLHAFSVALRDQMEGGPVSVFEVLAPQVRTAMTAGRGAADMLSPEQFAAIVLDGMERDDFEMYPGVMRRIALMHRLSPKLAARYVRSLAERARAG
jgi:uncharacterized oxidoreductase